MADDDPRDERLGKLLEVEPLDELARRRLVSTAMRASAPPARSRLAGQARNRLVAVAAVAAVVVVGGLSYLALRGNDNAAPSAASALTTSPATASSSATAQPKSQSETSGSTADRAETAAPNAAAATAQPRDLGDFGDLQVSANLDRLRATTTSSALSASAPQDQAENRASVVTRLRALACAAELPEGTIVAIGTAQFGTRDAIVVLTSLADGTTSLDAVVTHPCEVRPLD
jgi:hypothetical protein